MFAKLAVFTALLATLAAATPVPQGAAAASQCSTGPIQCCNEIQKPSDLPPPLQAIVALLGVGLQDTNVQVGVQCTPVTVIGALGSNSCTGTTACCQNNNVGGPVSLGCVPVNVN